MGDIVHVLPSLELLRRRFPQEPLYFLAQKPFGDVVPRHLGVRVLGISPHADGREMLRVIRTIRRLKPDRLIDFFGNPRTALISALSGVPWRAGFRYRIRKWAYHHTFEPRDPNVHLYRLFAEFLDSVNLGGDPPRPRLQPSPAAIQKATEMLTKQGGKRPLLGINPHATYPSKAWPVEYFETLIQAWFQKTKTPALIFWGPGEEATALAMVSRLGDAAFTHPALSIDELLGLLQQVDLFVTGDTGPMNLAWALDVPIVALFGPTTRKAVAPDGPQHLVLHHPTLPCLQCHKEVCADGRCMTEMTPLWVFQRIQETYADLFHQASFNPTSRRLF
jgi:heptosyltransferase-2